LILKIKAKESVLFTHTKLRNRTMKSLLSWDGRSCSEFENHLSNYRRRCKINHIKINYGFCSGGTVTSINYKLSFKCYVYDFMLQWAKHHRKKQPACAVYSRSKHGELQWRDTCMRVRCRQHPSRAIGKTVSESQIECGVMEYVPTRPASQPTCLTRVSVVPRQIICNYILFYKLTSLTNYTPYCTRTFQKPICVSYTHCLERFMSYGWEVTNKLSIALQATSFVHYLMHNFYRTNSLI
jgi:hypothetical protein